MMKQLVQGVCGGIRWLDTKDMAQYLASRAVSEGFPASKIQRKALGAQRCSNRKGSRRRTAPPSCNTLVPSPNQLLPTEQRRLLSYDVLDCTLGSGYHAGAVLENGRPYTRVVALDCDVTATKTARGLSSKFGGERFRFYNSRMSEAKSMFGEKAFDAIIIDPGPSVSQLENPERGFLLDEESDHCFDMRYSSEFGMGALEYINSASQHTLANALRSCRILTPEQSMKLARAIRVNRPFRGSTKIFEVVQIAGNELPEEGWASQSSRRKTPMSWKFLVSLRCIVNREMDELRQTLHDSILILRDNGRAVVFTRLQWEEELLKSMVAEHPHAQLSYFIKIDCPQVQEHGHSRHTIMWVVTKVKGSSFALKNSTTLTEDKVQESSVRWMGGMFAGQTHGFPAHNFSFESMDEKEWRVKRRNEAPPEFDWDDENVR